MATYPVTYAKIVIKMARLLHTHLKYAKQSPVYNLNYEIEPLSENAFES